MAEPYYEDVDLVVTSPPYGHTLVWRGHHCSMWVEAI